MRIRSQNFSYDQTNVCRCVSGKLIEEVEKTAWDKQGHYLPLTYVCAANGGAKLSRTIQGYVCPRLCALLPNPIPLK